MSRYSVVSLIVLLSLITGMNVFAQTNETKWAVVIGVSDYQESEFKLKYANHDAQEMQKRLLEAGLDNAHIRFLIDKEATGKNIAGAFLTLAKSVGSNDVVFIYYSGHGYQGKDLGEQPDEVDGMDEYILPFDAEKNDESTWIRDDIFNDWIGSLKAKLIVMVFDSCYAGGAAKNVKTVGSSSKSPLKDSFFRDIQRKGTFVVAACADNEKAIEKDEFQQGLFTYYWLNIFNRSRFSTTPDRSLFEDVIKKVKESNPDQTPVLIDNAKEELSPISEFLPPIGIEFTTIPGDEIGGPDSSADVAGKIVGMDPKLASKDYRIVLYVRTDRWYIQPTQAEPFTMIEEDGTWGNWVHTGKKYAALLVKPSFNPPTTYNSLPKAGGDVIAKIEVEGTK